MRASYQHAINWIALNDDTQWLDDGPNAYESVTACLVADIFGKSTEQVTKDLRKAIAQNNRGA